jgi:hypothetical protein
VTAVKRVSILILNLLSKISTQLTSSNEGEIDKHINSLKGCSAIGVGRWDTSRPIVVEGRQASPRSPSRVVILLLVVVVVVLVVMVEVIPLRTRPM